MKNILLSLLLSASAATAFAAPLTVTFTVQGADYTDVWGGGPTWTPSARLVVSFTGEDLNNDQEITASELTHLHGYGRDYLTPETPSAAYDIREFSFRSATDY